MTQARQQGLDGYALSNAIHPTDFVLRGCVFGGWGEGESTEQTTPRPEHGVEGAYTII